MATYSGILAWRIPWIEEPGYSPQGHKEQDTTEATQKSRIIKVKKKILCYLKKNQLSTHNPTNQSNNMNETPVRNLSFYQRCKQKGKYSLALGEVLKETTQQSSQWRCAVLCLVTSVVSDSATPWTGAGQAPLSMGFSRQEYQSGLPCPPPGQW